MGRTVGQDESEKQRRCRNCGKMLGRFSFTRFCSDSCKESYEEERKEGWRSDEVPG